MPQQTKLKDASPAALPRREARTSWLGELLRRYRRPRILTIVLAILASIVLAHIMLVARNPALIPPANCMTLVRLTDYTQVVHLQTQSQQMSAVEFVSGLDGGAPATLVQVTHNDAQNTLDTYVFGCVMHNQQPQLQTLFSQQGLAQGTVEVSQAQTLITGEVDTHLLAQNIAFLQPLQQNVYREYAWQNGNFTQVMFPGLYPVTSRAEAEALQQESNNGQNMPWGDPLVTAQQMTKDLLQWAQTPTGTILENNGSTARVLLTSQSPHLALIVTLSRLVENDAKGLWFVTGAHTQGATLDTVEQKLGIPTQPVTSPLTFAGTSLLTDGPATTTLFDHTLTPLAGANGVKLQVKRDGTYTGNLTYENIASGQQGVLAVESVPQPRNNQKELGQVLLVSLLLS